jgi:hypothetical protein
MATYTVRLLVLLLVLLVGITLGVLGAGLMPLNGVSNRRLS